MADAIAEPRKVTPESVLCGAGSSNLIFLALRQLLRPSAHTLILDPTYGEYAHVLEQVIGCQVDRFTLARNRNYELDIDHLGSVLEREYNLAVLVNPNSPTGRFADPDRISHLTRRPPAKTLFGGLAKRTLITLVPTARWNAWQHKRPLWWSASRCRRYTR